MYLNMQQGLMLLASSATPAIADPGIIVGSVILMAVVFEWGMAIHNMHDLTLTRDGTGGWGDRVERYDTLYDEPWLGVQMMR